MFAHRIIADSEPSPESEPEAGVGAVRLGFDAILFNPIRYIVMNITADSPRLSYLDSCHGSRSAVKNCVRECLKQQIPVPAEVKKR